MTVPAPRRTLLRAAAWAAPVAALSTAAPALAISPTTPIDVTYNQESCKQTGDFGPDGKKRYRLVFDVENQTNQPLEYRVVSIVVEPNSDTPITFFDITTTWAGTLEPGESATVREVSDASGDLGNGTAKVDIEVRFTDGSTETVTTFVQVESFPPCQD
ncbi:hypothetical protein JSY14_02700 [Brachybacterium sp. EF45031]|uniref:hypothetical protein n=1 Tax=Brachybacterium sillae TaxID=2810536 RepID=UPI00217EA9EB|nr:hypothetical protein [Brachybacterium sillae]MCS6710976.1 hypothetical protein [Brachybacterium sillae]